MKHLQKEQLDFLNWVLNNFDLPTTAIYKVKGIVRHKKYGDTQVGILNNIREIYGGAWRTEKKRQGIEYLRGEVKLYL